MLVGMAALLSGIIGLSGAAGLVIWSGLPSEARHFDESFWMVAVAAGVGLLAALLLALKALKVWRGTDFRGYDPKDPDDRGIKW